MLLKVPYFPALFHFVSLSSCPSFVMILCFVLFFILVYSSHFFPLRCFLLSMFLSLSLRFYSSLCLSLHSLFRYLLSPLFSVTVIWVVGCKIKRIFKVVSVFTEISGCQLLSGMKSWDTMCILISILHFFETYVGNGTSS